MRRGYAMILRLYPADFRAMFEAEMMESFELSGKSVTKEFFSALTGAIREHAAKFLHSETYLRSATDFEQR